MMKIGIGIDVHKLVKGRKLILGGVEIPFELGLAGHSDADVLVHSICDALLGAACLGDIGRLFPDSDQQYRDISSIILLQEVNEKLEQNNFTVENIDSVVICEKPKISEYIETMRKNIAKALSTGVERISIKGTTTEGLGFEGQGKGIKALTVCLIQKRE